MILKVLLAINANDNEIFLTKVELFNELVNCNKVKTMDQRKAFKYLLKYMIEQGSNDFIIKLFDDMKIPNDICFSTSL